MDFTPSLNAKGFFRFTGPPENWLTAIKYMTWGIEEKYKNRWKEIQPGDIFFIHSTGKSLFNNAKSGIVGLGVVGSNFSIKENKLWLHEIKDNQNKWPLLVPFSEIYLFGELPDQDTWQSPNLLNQKETKNLIDRLLKNNIPLSQVQGFPQMGSFSAVSKDVAKHILFDKRPLHEYIGTAIAPDDNIYTAKPTKLIEVKDATESLRYADSLKVFDTIKRRLLTENKSQYTKNNELLAKAETVHADVLQQLIDIFRKKGYDTRSNRFVDLFAYNKNKSFLLEVKSTENKNFRSQARKGLIQLFEYDYFEIRRFVDENKLDFKEKYKILVPSQIPKDNGYVEFINNLQVGVATVDNDSLKAIGTDLGFTKI